ncbi:M1 family metallopeptidase [Nocardioides daphniae]|uniref:Aminopeptidase N n=1 Tax=Nocardioides daphniae TaxID=402297 RepID=A0A4P7UDD8_9ACTN|nr:M1 family metallopeptidase [Nocardioides daphniae]QCC76929.1 M1 family peptidase [Nocardioides daphniae]GGD17801.1 peptidase [Nocardioides daphniae]
MKGLRGRAPRRTRARLLAGAVTTVLLVGLVGPSAGDSTSAQGTSGIGDAYFPLDGNGGYDVRHYDVRVRYDFARRHLGGTATLTLVPSVDLKRLNLDLLLKASAVKVNGTPATFRKDGGHELVVTPRTVLKAGRTAKVTVRYAGFPGRQRYLGEGNWLASRHEVVTINQPHMAPWWFPANDHPSDKATFRVAVTVPQGKRVISNGRLLGRVRKGRTQTWQWGARDPMATYLAFFAAGDFAVERGTTDGLPWFNAVSTRLDARSQRQSLTQLRRSAALVRQMERDLGPYPFETTGGVVTSLMAGFALENQTRPVYWPLETGSTWLLVHELAHQWFGDAVAVARWRDIWLNEGAATFMEQRHAERTGGRPVGEWLQEQYAAFAAQDSFWDLAIARPGADNLFHDAVYLRGGMTLQALRQRIGEQDFWTLLRRWIATHDDGNASTAQFEKLAAEVSGEQLSGFFDAWLRTPAKPAATRDNGLVLGAPSGG